MTALTRQTGQDTDIISSEYIDNSEQIKKITYLIVC